MDESTPASRSWWGRKSRRTKLLLVVSVLLLAIALGLGLGLGLGLNKGGEESPSASGSPSASPPSPSDALPPTPKDLGIWQPATNTSWQIILSGTAALTTGATAVVPDVDVFDLDLFVTPQTTIDALHSLGKKVICYFSAGSFEKGRPDAAQFKSRDLGKTMSGWKDEKWLDLRSQNVRAIMMARMELAAQKKCDGVDPDNTDAYDNDNGLGMTKSDSVALLHLLTTKAQQLRLAIGLKNSAAIIPAALPAMQYAVNEECVANGECASYAPFVGAGKPVFHIEYPAKAKAGFASNFCKTDGPAEGAFNFSTVIKNYDLDGWVEYCNGETYATPT